MAKTPVTIKRAWQCVVRLGSTAALVAASAFATSAHATAIYDYVGSNYTFAQPPYTTMMHLEFVITLNSVVPAGATTTEVNNLPGFTMLVSDGATNQYSPNSFPFAILTTDAAGDITDWVLIVSNVVGDAFFGADSDAIGDDVGNSVTHTTAFNRTPGSWTVSQQSTPEPATLALLGLGLAGLATTRRRAAR